MKTLIVRLSSIGDVVHTLPAFAALRGAGQELGWIVEPPALDLLVGQEGLSQVVEVPRAATAGPRAILETRRVLRAARYETALDFQGLWKSALWARMSGARDSVGFDADGRKEPGSRALLRRTIAAPPQAVHVIDKNLALLRAVGLEAVGSRAFPLPLTPRLIDGVTARLTGLGVTPKTFAILNPGGGWLSKIWPAERFGELAQRLGGEGLRSVVTFGPGDEGLADRVVSTSRGAARRAFATTLLEFAALAGAARVVVAADTGPLHIACSVKAPVVALFGPTDPARNGPFDSADVVVSATRRGCFPCYRRECATHAGVMATIGVDAVVAAVHERLGRVNVAV